MGGYESKTYGFIYREGDRFKAPDWRQYKVEDVKDLKWVQDELAKKGLRNPWLRNDVWRFQGYPGLPMALFKACTRGFVIAAALMVVTVAADKTIGLKRDMHLPPNSKYGEPHDHHGSSVHH